MLFNDRRHAGMILAGALAPYRGRDDVLVLALPRGGVPVGYEIARALEAPLDVFLVRELGAPSNPELAFGAIASGGIRVLDQGVVGSLALSEPAIEAVTAIERLELERREREYRGDLPALDARGRCAIVVDDGLATGSSMRAATEALRRQRPSRLVVAAPVAPLEVYAELRRAADEVICAATPDAYLSVGSWYRDFPQVSDEEVRALLSRARAAAVL